MWWQEKDNICLLTWRTPTVIVLCPSNIYIQLQCILNWHDWIWRIYQKTCSMPIFLSIFWVLRDSMGHFITVWGAVFRVTLLSSNILIGVILSALVCTGLTLFSIVWFILFVWQTFFWLTRNCDTFYRCETIVTNRSLSSLVKWKHSAL